MITDDELKQILRDAIKQSGNNISRWARDNGLWSQRGNISEMAYGKKKVSKRIAKKFRYKKPDGWVLEND